MSNYIFKIRNVNEIQAIDKKTKTVAGFIQFSEMMLSGHEYIEIDQVYTDATHRGGGLGTRLLLEIFRKAVAEKKGIHMFIQPGSSGFYKKFFNEQFHTKGLSLFKSSSFLQPRHT